MIVLKKQVIINRLFAGGETSRKQNTDYGRIGNVKFRGYEKMMDQIKFDWGYYHEIQRSKGKSENK